MPKFPTTYEKKWPSIIIPTIQIIDGKVIVPDTYKLHTKQFGYLRKGSEPALEFEIKRILSDTEIIVGPKGQKIEITFKQDTLHYYDGGSLTIEEQNRNPIGSEYVIRSVYEEEPAVAFRNVLVDRHGQHYTTDNPVPVQLSDGSINIGTVEGNLSVQLTHLDDWPNAGEINDSVRIGDGEDLLSINPDGSINVIIDGIGSDLVTITNKISSVAKDVTTTLLTYAVPLGKTFELMRVKVGGDDIATYEVYKNTTSIDLERTYFGGPLSSNLEFGIVQKGYLFQDGDTLQIKVTHSRPNLGSFEARVQGLMR